MLVAPGAGHKPDSVARLTAVGLLAGAILLVDGAERAVEAELFEARPNVMGGKLCFRGTRLPVEAILTVIYAGWDDAAILAEFTSLTPPALAAARALVTGPDGGWSEVRVA